MCQRLGAGVIKVRSVVVVCYIDCCDTAALPMGVRRCDAYL